VSPQALPRPSTPTAKKKPGGGRPAAKKPATAVRGTPPPPARVLRRPAVLALVAGGAAALAGLGWTFLSSSGTDAGVAVAGFSRPAATPSSPAPVTTSASTAADRAEARNPFADQPAEAVTAPTTPPHVADTTAAAEPSDASIPAAAAAPAVTVTVTAPGTETYVGLYAWNGSRASFRVNARTYSVQVGARFGSGLVFKGVVGTSPRCAQVTYSGGSVTLCPGQVTSLS
jgi:hypothetical protein